jgi:hypothetical protein
VRDRGIGEQRQAAEANTQRAQSDRRGKSVEDGSAASRSTRDRRASARGTPASGLSAETRVR